MVPLPWRPVGWPPTEDSSRKCGYRFTNPQAKNTFQRSPALGWNRPLLGTLLCSDNDWGHPTGSIVLPKGRGKFRGTAARSARQPCFRKQRSECCLSMTVAAIRPCSLWLLLCCIANHGPPSLSAPVLLTSLQLREHIEYSPLC